MVTVWLTRPLRPMWGRLWASRGPTASLRQSGWLQPWRRVPKRVLPRVLPKARQKPAPPQIPPRPRWVRDSYWGLPQHRENKESMGEIYSLRGTIGILEMLKLLKHRNKFWASYRILWFSRWRFHFVPKDFQFISTGTLLVCNRMAGM